jgi:hypothetical protein
MTPLHETDGRLLTAQKAEDLRRRENWRQLSAIKKLGVASRFVLQTTIVIGTFAAALYAMGETQPL